MKEIEKTFNANEKEPLMIQIWEESGLFSPEKFASYLKKAKRNDNTKPFVMTLPPPNANGDLHIGHTCGYSFQDCMGRYNRMLGRPTLLLPGKDHASIQTEAVFSKILQNSGESKWSIGREEFYKRCYEFCTKNSQNAREQEKRIGLSADWDRELFTLDPKLTEVIYDTFYKMFEDGLIYRGKYIVNQCTFCRTSLADVDTEHKESRGILAQIVYPFADDKDKELAKKEWGDGKTFMSEEIELLTPPSFDGITVATTRPETMLGDSAVAVNPGDPRYAKFIGKKVILPIMDKEIEIIADDEISMEFGTGALKVTPAHSPIDFKMGRRHNLKIVNVIDKDGKMQSPAPKEYIGMGTTDCSKALCAKLKEQGLLLGIENIKHEVTVCERCGTAIEPIISKQWFVDVSSLAKAVLSEIKKSEFKVIPFGQQKALEFFLKNIEPWCISRQLWWGQRIPVWYSGGRELYDSLMDLYEINLGREINPAEFEKISSVQRQKLISQYEEQMGQKAKGTGRAFAMEQQPDSDDEYKGNQKDIFWEKEEDLLDTWFSSGQWPFSTLGGPGAKDYETYYPTDVLETARDILFFWVVRMLLLGVYRTGKLPFHTVYLHGLILAPDGRKMSKSKGNGVEPKDVIDKYGADALRLWYYNDTAPGGNTPIREENIRANRNFVNKIWNAFRFVLMNIDDSEIVGVAGFLKSSKENVNKADAIWKARFDSAQESMNSVAKYIDKYRFNLASAEIREFFWHTVCDKWIEEVKANISDEETGSVKRINELGGLIFIMSQYLKIMHPFAPFITESVWQELYSLGLVATDTIIKEQL